MVILLSFVGLTTLSFAQYPWEKESTSTAKTSTTAAKSSMPAASKSTPAATAAKAPKVRPTGRNIYTKKRAQTTAAQTRAPISTATKMAEQKYP